MELKNTDNLFLVSKGSFCSRLDEMKIYINEWYTLLEEKYNQDKNELLQKYINEDYAEHEYFLLQFYNPLYAQILITIYSALEYDIKILCDLKHYSYKNFKQFLKNINNPYLSYVHELNMLRLYNNAYKHNGGAYTKELCLKFNKCKKNTDCEKCNKVNAVYKKEIDYTELNIDDYYKKARSFLLDLGKNIFQISH